MGQNESNPVRNMDKRTARREHRENFSSAIASYRCRRLGEEELEREGMDWETGIIRVCVRKRPIFPDEITHFEFDVITCVNRQTVVVHDARMHSDMKRMCLKHYQFNFDRIFHERNNNDEVYLETAAPMTQFAVEGGFATCLMYGQTGSGKTYTMSSIYERAALDIFRRISGGSYSVSISFCEISGDNCFDLLNSFNPAQLLTGRDGNVYAYPLVEPLVSTEEELLAFITFGCRVRTTAATGVHDSSSRSHALLKIYILDNESKLEGVLTLVDLAGSEHKIDSMYHSAERRKEGAAINSSLMALKECVRAKAAGKDLSHFYRKSKLTMALKASFADPSARTTVIVTVSPASKDTEHSLNSLRHACLMDGQDAPQQGKESRFATGGDLSVEWLGEINISAIAKKNKNRGHAEDLKTSNGNTFGSDVNREDKPLSDKEKLQMRRAAERAALKNLAPAVKSLLKTSRQQLGAVGRQNARLYRTNDASQAQLDQPPVEFGRFVAEHEPVVVGEDFHRKIERPTRALQHQQQPSEENLSPRSSNNMSRASHPNSSHPSQPPANSDRRPVRKLRMSIYGSDDGVPEDIKRRQFGVLLKQNGYSKAEIEDILQKEIDREQASSSCASEPMRREHSLRAQSSQPVAASPGNRIQTMSAGALRPMVQQELLPASIPIPPLSKHEAARLRRQQLETEAASKRVTSVKKIATATPVAAARDSNEAIAALETELQDPNLTSAARHGLMKRIATMRSVVVREERWKEQERRDAEKRMQQMKLAAAAEEAKRRLGIPSSSPVGTGGMRNTSQVESVWSPREPIQQTNSQAVGPFSGQQRSPYERPQPVNSLEPRSDSLDEYLHQSVPVHEASPPPRVGSNSRGRGRYSYGHGASSAPFANDMNWDR